MFQDGDVVRVRDDLVLYETYNGIRCFSNHVETSGMIGVVRDATDYDCLIEPLNPPPRFLNLYYGLSMLEPADDPCEVFDLPPIDELFCEVGT